MPLEPGPDEPTAWQPAALHPREGERLASLAAYGLVDTGAEIEYDRVAKLAQRLLNIPVVLIALLDEERMFCKTQVGIEGCDIRRDESLCGHALLQDEPLLIPDVRAHPLYRHSPAVKRYDIGFYMGIVLKDAAGLPLGTLCLIDRTTRTPDPAWIEAAIDFAEVVRDEMARSRSDRETQTLLADLQRSQRLYATLVATVPGVVFRVVRESSGRLRYRFISEGIRDLCGLSAEEYTAMTERGESRVHPEDRPALAAEYEASARTLEPVLWQGRLEARSGHYRWVQTVARPDVLEDGTIKWSGIVTDVTPMKAVEAEIREMNRTLEVRVEARTRDLQEAQIEMLTRLGLAAESRDDDTGAHIARVARVSGILAREMGMSAEECEMVRQATPMHD
ncbi:GAF domain-containing protein, partial [bacterium]